MPRRDSLTPTPSLLRALWDVVIAWYRCDAIRASVRDGQLLRLSPPCIVSLCGEVYQVKGRVVGQDERGRYVSYACLRDSVACELQVRSLGPSLRPLVRLLCDERAEEVDPDALRVFG